MAVVMEFVGCSGAGKSTLATAVAERLAPQAVLASSVLTDRPLRRWITNPHARNLLADVVALPWLARTWSEHRRFVRFAFARLNRHAPSTFARLNYKRNIVRRVGIHEMLRNHDHSAAVLVDEGAVLSAYHLYVYSTGTHDQGELDRFADLVPLPDHIVYVTAPVEALVERAMSRPDRRRELTSDDPARIRREIQRAVDVFEALASCPSLAERIVTVDDPLGDPVRCDAALQRVAGVLDIPANPGRGAAPTLPANPEED